MVLLHPGMLKVFINHVQYRKPHTILICFVVLETRYTNDRN
jgi:hypothetical protein